MELSQLVLLADFGVYTIASPATDGGEFVGFHFDTDVIEKLRDKHNVTQKEVIECFANGEAIYFKDEREEHRTDPPTWWFISLTNRNRILKVCFIRRDGEIVIKTAYAPSTDGPLEMYIQKANLPSTWPWEDEE